MRVSRDAGFTQLEFALGSSLLVILMLVLLPTYVRATNADREAETMDNLHTIQIAVERYYVDRGTYPAWLLGGDAEGWGAWHDKWDGVNDMEMSQEMIATNSIVDDPLIRDTYLASYPSNPFVDDGSAVITRTSAVGSNEPGEGDPRFGMNGDVMGMGLDDPNFFKGAIQRGNFTWSNVETRRTLDHGEWQDVPAEFIDREYCMYYLFGGITEPYMNTGQTTYTYWPGNFFYKSATDVVLPARHGFTQPVPNTNGVHGPKDRYILGCYGAENNPGMDVIRLTWFSPDGGDTLHWRTPPPMPSNTYRLGYDDFVATGGSGGLPEVFGGGDEYNGPWWYYNEGGRNEGAFIHGAPDGIRDGVILVLTENGEMDSSGRWN